MFQIEKLNFFTKIILAKKGDSKFITTFIKGEVNLLYCPFTSVTTPEHAMVFIIEIYVPFVKQLAVNYFCH